ncbi:MAG: dihydroorotate dehydrogenase electron transfer subunit [Planctomycetia bacterium]
MTSEEICLPGMSSCAGQYVATVSRVRHLARDTWAVRVECPQLAETIVPGQFFMIRPLTGSDPLLGRPFAFYDVCCNDAGRPVAVEFGFVRVGKMTTLMSHWREGEQVSLWGPLGNGFPVPACEHLICVAGGIGQTPFLGVAKEVLGLAEYGNPPRQPATRPAKITLCYGVRSQPWLAGLDDFKLPGLELQIATDDGSFGHHGYVTSLLRNQLQQNRQGVHVYCCGPEPMMKATAEICAAEDVPCWLSLETPMACGFGACFSCVTRVRVAADEWDYRRTCVEGPVFRADQLVLSDH